MERKNTVLLTVIAVATLLVAVVGATFAYFTATTNASGDTNNATSTVNTAKVADISFSKESYTGTTNTIWPGTMNAVGAGFTAKVGGEGITNQYDITYTVKGKIDLKNSISVNEDFKFPVKWRLYELDTKAQDNLVSCPTSPTVTPNPENPNENHYSITCTENESFDPETNGENIVASGVIQNSSDECSPSGDGQGKDQVACGNAVNVSYNGSVTVSSTAVSKYYYLVVEYPNEENNSQNLDMNKQIVFSISDISVDKTVEHS